jgi:hypothetical protein
MDVPYANVANSEELAPRRASYYIKRTVKGGARVVSSSARVVSNGVVSGARVVSSGVTTGARAVGHASDKAVKYIFRPWVGYALVAALCSGTGNHFLSDMAAAKGLAGAYPLSIGFIVMGLIYHIAKPSSIDVYFTKEEG